MSWYRNALAVLAGTALAAPVSAQDNGETFLLATYYECDYALEGTADAMMQRLSPVLQKHVDAGHINGYNMSAHLMGGPWRRLVTMTGPRDALLNIWTGLDAEFQAHDAAASAQLSATCGTHQDYLWAQVANSSAPATGPDQNQFRLSTYFFCNQAQETSVDTLVTDVIGPELQKHVAAGHLGGWGWLRHDNGGTVRRVLTFTAPTVPALFQMRDAVMEGVGQEAAQKLYAGACGNHFEYIWASVPLNP